MTNLIRLGDAWVDPDHVTALEPYNGGRHTHVHGAGVLANDGKPIPVAIHLGLDGPDSPCAIVGSLHDRHEGAIIRRDAVTSVERYFGDSGSRVHLTNGPELLLRVPLDQVLDALQVTGR